MSWRGTLLLLILAALAICLLLLTGKSHTGATRESLLDIDPAQATRIVIREGSGSVTLSKQNGIWSIGLNPVDRADPEAVRALLHCASGIKPLDTLRRGELKGPISLESLDLNTPKRSLTFEAGKSETIDLGIEGATPAQLYARLRSSGSVYLIPSEIAALAFRPVQDFRDPRLTTFSPDHLEEISYSRGNSLQQLVLKKVRSEWKLVIPFTANGDQQEISGWLNSLRTARVARWMPPDTDPASCGLDSPAGTFTTREEGGYAPVTVTIGSEVPDTPGSRYARCSNRPGLCVISGIEPFLGITPMALRSKKLQRVEHDAIDRIEIRQADGTAVPLVLVREKGSENWKLTEGGPDSPSSVLTGALMKEWLGKIEGITARGFEPATPDTLQSRGLSRPTLIRLIAHLSENTAEEASGDMILAEYAFGTPSEGVVALREGNAPDFMLLPESSLELTKGPGERPGK